MTVVLALDSVAARYGRVDIISGISIKVNAGEFVALVGPNGAGKTTTLKVAAGQLRPTEGTVSICGSYLRHRSVTEAARLGLGYVPERRELFTSLTVKQHLRLASRGSHPHCLEVFPELIHLADRPAGVLSGGEQQMLAIARALALQPRVLVIDELSLGLAPLIAERIIERLRSLTAKGTGVLLVEQHARTAIAVSDRAYVIAQGRIAAAGRPDELSDPTLLASTYLG